MSTTKEMDKYRCHKEVWAFKIEDMVNNEDRDDGSFSLFGTGGEEVDVSGEYMDKHNPHIGGYFVLYKGGYQSYSPAVPFEEGYSLILETH